VRFALYPRGTSCEAHSETENVLPATPTSKVLILTAAAGGGHEAAGQAVRAELEQADHRVVMTDGLRAMSRPLNWLLVRGYAGQVKHTPGSMATVFAVTSRRRGATAVQSIVSLLFASRLLELVRRERPNLVVSTYPLVTAALGYLRSSGRLRAPVAAVIADYGVHPLWVAPRADLHLVVSRPSAALTRYAGGKASLVRLPVAPGFRSALTREGARATLGLSQGAFVALVVGGAWGAGDLEEAARCAAESGAYAIVVTGKNEELRARLQARFKSEENVRVLGWREDMPTLMAAADCLIQNAGGMTCIEAMEMGLPMLIFNPIPGHGKLNAKVMEQAGVARWVRTAEELRALLRPLIRRETSLSTPNGESDAPTVSAILEPLVSSAPQPVLTRWVARPRLLLIGTAAVLFCCWLLLFRVWR
jgi:processive 1,2-diacylglycerol beta-glucosyltransferase